MYDYNEHIKWLTSEEGQKAVLRALTNARHLHALAGAFSEAHVVKDMGVSNSWNQLAVIDHLVRFGYLRRIDTECYRPGYYRYTE
jgi:hypothetical protein